MTELDAQIVEDNDVVDEQPMDEEPSLVLGDEDPRDAELHEKILSEETAWRGKILDVRSLEVELPNGRRTGRDIVRHPGAAAVVALIGSAVVLRKK